MTQTEIYFRSAKDINMKIAHFSDPHLGAPTDDWTALFDKRWVGLFNYKFRRSFQHDPKYLEAAVEHVVNNKFDVAVCTGDLTNTGQPNEFATVKKILQKLIDSDIPVIYTPGNHDCYVRRKHCVEAVRDMFKYVNKSDDELDDLPLVRHINGIDFIVLNNSRPSNLLCSWAFVRKKDADRIENFCSQEKKYPRILINHYPIIEEHPFLRFRHSLFGQKKILELLKNKSIDLSICGHRHFYYTACDETGRGELCSGSVTKNALMSEIEFKDDAFNFKKIYLNKQD